MKLKNRIMMSAIGTHESVESEGRKSVIDKLIAYHVARAKDGNGLNTVEVTAVDKASAPFDFLEFHCAHNYLLHSMLSSGINHRSNEWGGSFENQ